MTRSRPLYDLSTNVVSGNNWSYTSRMAPLFAELPQFPLPCSKKIEFKVRKKVYPEIDLGIYTVLYYVQQTYR